MGLNPEKSSDQRKMDVVFDSDDYEIFIHVGMHGTGTTFLQDKVFPKLVGINLIRPRTKFLHGTPDFVVYPIKSGKNLISNELLSCNPFHNKLQRSLVADDRFVVVDYLKKVFPHGKIIVCTLNRIGWVVSRYSQYKKSGRHGSFNEFCDSCNIYSWLDFKDYTDYIKKVFPSVFHYTYEDFKADPHKVVEDMCGFMGVDVPEFENVVVNPSIFSKVQKKVFMEDWKKR